MAAQHLDDLAAVRTLVQLYIDGASGNGDLLREAFHPDTRMFGHIGDLETYEPIAEYIE